MHAKFLCQVICDVCICISTHWDSVKGSPSVAKSRTLLLKSYLKSLKSEIKFYCGKIISKIILNFIIKHGTIRHSLCSTDELHVRGLFFRYHEAQVVAIVNCLLAAAKSLFNTKLTCLL